MMYGGDWAVFTESMSMSMAMAMAAGGAELLSEIPSHTAFSCWLAEAQFPSTQKQRAQFLGIAIERDKEVVAVLVVVGSATERVSINKMETNFLLTRISCRVSNCEMMWSNEVVSWLGMRYPYNYRKGSYSQDKRSRLWLIMVDNPHLSKARPEEIQFDSI
jgi:hypothetical protein